MERLQCCCDHQFARIAFAGLLMIERCLVHLRGRHKNEILSLHECVPWLLKQRNIAVTSRSNL